MSERTLAIIKPDAVKKNAIGDIIARYDKAGLKPVAREDGVHTAGSSSQISDGAGAVLIMTADKASALGLTPKARIVDTCLVGVDPVLMLTGPIDATHRLLERIHEAELAQGESLTGIRPLVRFWVHTGLVNLSGRKMSKTAGNTQLVRELLREFSADELRYYLLSWHYRDDVEFSHPRLKSASKAYSRAVAKAGKLKTFAAKTTSRVGPSADAVRRRLSPFYSAMNDDVDTPKAIEWVEDELIGGSSSDEARDYSALRIASDVLGVDFLAKP
jgi:hypothetical protein